MATLTVPQNKTNGVIAKGLTEVNTTTESAQQIDQRQSLDVAKILLHGTLSGLSYLRDIFYEQCFDEQFYDQSDRHVQYQEYISGLNFTSLPNASPDSSLRRRSTPRPGTKVRVLKRGRTKEVDQFLDWLEEGVFDALKTGVLHAMQLRVFEDESNPSHVLETYTFTFKYTKAPDKMPLLDEVELKGPEGNRMSLGTTGVETAGDKALTVKAVKARLQKLIRSMVEIIKDLPDLPEKRYLKMHLYYTDDCDPGYEPPGFEKLEDASTFFPKDQGWHMRSEEVGIFYASYHSINLKVSHLQQHQAPDDEQAEDGLIKIPPGLKYADSTMVEEFRLDSTQDLSPQPNPDHQWSAPIAVPHDVKDQELSVGDKVAAPRVVQHPYTAFAKEPTDRRELELQEADALSKKDFFKNLLDQSTQLSSLQPTQELPHHRGRFTKEGELEINLVDEFHAQSQLRFSQRTLTVLSKANNMSSKGETGRHGRSRLGPLAEQKKPLVRCQCLWNEDDGEMIQCDCCDTWQHLQCYGYAGHGDPREPEVHLCYSCMLGATEKPLLEEMGHLALLRRAAHSLREKGYTSDQALARDLRKSTLNFLSQPEANGLSDCDLSTAKMVAAQFRRKNYLVSTKGSGMVPKNNKTKFILNRSPSTYGTFKKEFFNPTSKIAHHFEFMDVEIEDATHLTQLNEHLSDTGLASFDELNSMQPEYAQQGDVGDSYGQTSAHHTDPQHDVTLLEVNGRETESVELQASASNQDQPEQHSPELPVRSASKIGLQERRYTLRSASSQPTSVVAPLKNAPVRKRSHEAEIQSDEPKRKKPKASQSKKTVRTMHGG